MCRTTTTCPTAKELDADVLTTTNGEPYSLRQACELAYAVWVRFGRDDTEAARAWHRLLEHAIPVGGDLEVADFMRLVDCHLFSLNRSRQAREWYRNPRNRVSEQGVRASKV